MIIDKRAFCWDLEEHLTNFTVEQKNCKHPLDNSGPRCAGLVLVQISDLCFSNTITRTVYTYVL
jgi:hypothetical protein